MLDEPEFARDVLALFRKGHSTAEIARTFEVPESEIYNRMDRYRQMERDAQPVRASA